MTDLRKAAKMALEALEDSMYPQKKQFDAIIDLRQALAQDEQVSGDTSDGYHTFNELYDFRKAYNAALFNEWAASGKYSVHKSKRHYDGKECFGGGWFIVVAQLPNGQISNHYEMKDWDKFQLPEADKALFEYDNHTGADVLHRLFSLQPFAQPDNTSDSATRSADSAESFCKQELHNLMSVAGRMALELECLLLDTENLSVVSKWWDTGMEALQAYRHYVWSVTHGKDCEHFCDTHCVHTDHHPDCKITEQEPVALKQLRDLHKVQGSDGSWDAHPYGCGLYNGLELALSLFEKREPMFKEPDHPEQEPVAWSVLDKRRGKHWYTHESKYTAQYYANLYSHKETDGSPSMVVTPLYTAPPKQPKQEPVAWCELNVIGEIAYFDGRAMIMPGKVGNDCHPVPLYTAPPKREWVGLTDEEFIKILRETSDRIELLLAIEAKLKEKNT